MISRVLHMVVGEAGARAAAALRKLETSEFVSWTVREAPRAGDPGLGAACDASVRLLRKGLRLRDLDLVVAHGWALAPAAERLTQRNGAALVVCAWSPPLPAVEELEAWVRSQADLILEGPAALGGGLTAPGQLAQAYRAALQRRRNRISPSGLKRNYDVVVRGEGLSEELVDVLFTKLKRVVVEQGSGRADWRVRCTRSRVALLGQGLRDLPALAADARAAGCLPIVVGHASGATPDLVVDEPGALPALLDYLADPGRLSERLGEVLAGAASSQGVTDPGTSRPLRIVLNHGGAVANELRHSLAPTGWELRPLAEPGDPLPTADLLLVLPYGDPAGGLEALRRARRLGVPTAFWNVEDPRYFFDSEFGPLVRASAAEATAVFSTTLQLAAEYAELGVQVRYLPNYGRGFFRCEPRAESERTIDLLFLGTFTPDRKKFLAALTGELGSSVNVVARQDVREPGQVRELVANARLGLSIGSMTDANSPRGPQRGEGLTERVFDYPLAGTPVITVARGHLVPTFVPEEDVFVSGDARSTATRVIQLLSDPVQRDRVMLNARRKILERHLGVHRILTIVETLAEVADATGVLTSAAEAARGALSGEPRARCP